jgi:CDP-diglyceride synthetase
LLSHIFDINKLLAICFGLFISVFSVLGDFLASYYKRYNKVKDYSNLIPAHGGVLDRFDSLIMASAGFYALLMLDFTNPNVFYFMVYVFAFLLLFLIGELAYHSLQSEVEISRKWVHIASGLLCLTFPIYINNHLLVMLLCVNFIFILLLSKHFYFLPSINKIDRKSYGSMLFPVSVYCCFLCFQYYNNQYFYFYLPILILAVCDPVAALVGKKWPLGKYKVGNDYKTLIGSMAFFVSCFLILLVSLSAFMPLNSLATIIMGSFLIAMSTTLVEAFSRNGFDNLTIPSSVILCLIMF